MITSTLTSTSSSRIIGCTLILSTIVGSPFIRIRDAEGIWTIARLIHYHMGHRPARSAGNMPTRFLPLDTKNLLKDHMRHQVPLSCLLSKLTDDIELPPTEDGDQAPSLMLARYDLANLLAAERKRMELLLSGSAAGVSESAVLFSKLRTDNIIVYVAISTMRSTSNLEEPLSTEVQVKTIVEGAPGYVTRTPREQASLLVGAKPRQG